VSDNHAASGRFSHSPSSLIFWEGQLLTQVQFIWTRLMARSDYIAVVDDEQIQRDLFASYLNEHNVAVKAVASGSELSKLLDDAEPMLVVLDLNLGGEDGLDVLRKVRSRSDVPVVIVTGHRVDDVDRIVGFELGADDYMQKPVSPRELLARILAVLRRHEISRKPQTALSERGGYLFAGWRLTKRSRTLLNPAQEVVPLTKAEYALLIAFLASPQRPLTRDHLLASTRAHDDVFHRSIDVKVLRLRRKLRSGSHSSVMIRTEPGVGYSFTPAVERF
jgi:two-component system OmpR family response regulator